MRFFRHRRPHISPLLPYSPVIYFQLICTFSDVFRGTASINMASSVSVGMALSGDQCFYIEIVNFTQCVHCVVVRKKQFSSSVHVWRRFSRYRKSTSSHLPPPPASPVIYFQLICTTQYRLSIMSSLSRFCFSRCLRPPVF